MTAFGRLEKGWKGERRLRRFWFSRVRFSVVLHGLAKRLRVALDV